MDIAIKKKHPLIKYRYYLIGGVMFLGLLVYVLIAAIGPRKLRYNAENLEIVAVKQDNFYDYLDAEGIVQPKLTLKLNSQESGTVERIVAEEGSMLHEGDTIMVLSNPELIRTIEDEYDELQKQRILHEEKLLEMQRKSSQLRRQTLETMYKLNRQQKQYYLDQQERELGVKTKAQFEIATDEYHFNQKNTSLMLQELQHDSLLNIIQTGLMKNDMKREEERFRRNRERKENLVIRAPIAGQLSFISVGNGERIGAGSSIGELKVIDQFKIKTRISEYYIDRISTGLPATIAYQDKKYPLRITKVNPEIKDRQFEVDLVFAGELPDNIRIGKNYRIQIELGQAESALVVSKGNFLPSTGGQWIFKLNESGGKAVKVPVSIGRQNPQQYEILSGLQPGDRVIISGYENFGEAQELIIKR